MLNQPNNLMLVVLGVALAFIGCAAAADDLRRRMVSNWITVPAVVAGLCAWSIHSGVRGFVYSVAGLAVGFGAFLLLYLFGGMGGGDLKLMAGFGALLGPDSALMATLLAMIAGAVMAAGILGYRALKRPRTAGTTSSDRTLPYAPAVVLGTWIAFLLRG